MALIKDIQTPQWATGNYHKIIKVELFASTESLQVTMAVYASAEARDGGASPLWHEYVSIPISALNSDPRASIYPLVAGYWASYAQGAIPDQEVPPVPLPIELDAGATQPPPAPPAPPPYGD